MIVKTNSRHKWQESGAYSFAEAAAAECASHARARLCSVWPVGTSACGWLNNPPPDVYIGTPRTCGFVTSYGTRNFVDAITLIWRGENTTPHYLGGYDVITRVLISGSRRARVRGRVMWRGTQRWEDGLWRWKKGVQNKEYGFQNREKAWKQNLPPRVWKEPVLPTFCL